MTVAERALAEQIAGLKRLVERGEKRKAYLESHHGRASIVIDKYDHDLMCGALATLEAMAAPEDARREAITSALEILHEEGWLGRSEQRIRCLIDPMPEGYPIANEVGDSPSPQQPTLESKEPNFDRWAAKLWLWKNGHHYLAFDSEYPTYDGGDPKTLGEPVGYALLEWDTYERFAAQRVTAATDKARRETIALLGNAIHKFAPDLSLELTGRYNVAVGEAEAALAEFLDSISTIPVQDAEPTTGEGEGQADAVGRTGGANPPTGASPQNPGDASTESEQ